MIMASEQLKGMGKKFWIYLSLSTIFIWSSRYLLLNFLMASFTKITMSEHLLIFGKQIVSMDCHAYIAYTGQQWRCRSYISFFFQGASRRLHYDSKCAMAHVYLLSIPFSGGIFPAKVD
jgi:hypothetical protein